MSTGAYLAFAATGFKRQLAYRVANWSGLFTNSFFLFFRAYFLEACFRNRDVIGGFDVAHAMTYAALTQALLMVIPQWGAVGIAGDVRTGQIASDLARPIDYFAIHMSRRLGVSAYYVAVRCLPLLVLAAATGILAPPATWSVLPWVALSVVLAAWLANCILFMVEVSAFWLESERGIRYSMMAVGNLLSGLLIPLAFFPTWLIPLARVSPFRYSLSFPAEVYLGVLSADELWAGFAMQLGWVVILTLCARALFSRGVRRLVIHGG